MSSRTLSALILAVVVLLVSGAAHAKPPAKTVQVDCSKGQTINRALDDLAEELVILFSGACQEDVLITRGRVTLRGSGAGATVAGAPGVDPSVRQAGVTIRGVSNVTLEDFAVHDSDSRGIQMNHSSAVTMDSLVVDNNPRGGLILLEGSSATVRDSSFDNNGGDGIGVWENSGLQVQGTVSASANARVGWLISGGSALSVSTAGGNFTADNNAIAGFFLQLTATAQVGSASPVTVSASGNGDSGVSVILQSSWGGRLAVSGSEFGLLLSGGTFDSPLNASACTFGLYAQLNSVFDLRAGTLISGNEFGVWVDGTTARINSSTVVSNNAQDVHLEFGSHASFSGANQIGTVHCDDTVLVRGNVSCTNTPAQSLKKLSADSDRSAQGVSKPLVEILPLLP